MREPPGLRHPNASPCVFRATAEQAVVIQRAIRALRVAEGDPSIPAGRALELICGDFLSGPPSNAQNDHSDQT